MQVNLIGLPKVETPGSVPYRPRSRKTWAILGYLALSARPPSRSRLGSLLFGEADDPLRALRWSLSELRRVLGGRTELGGDPVTMVLPADATVDTTVLTTGHWKEAVALPNLGDDLLEGIDPVGAPEFQSWLLAQRRHISASTENILHEATVALLARGDLDEALRLAVTLVGLNPYQESHQAALIRAYLMRGDEVAARRQFEVCTELYARELGVAPGLAVRTALLAPTVAAAPIGDATTLDALIEAGRAALAGGTPDAAVASFRSGVALADSVGDAHRRISVRLALAAAVLHSTRGDDEEGAMLLLETEEMAREAEEWELCARARLELGYLNMLAARYDRAEQWLTTENLPAGDDGTMARAFSYLGCLQSDRAEYENARDLLERAVVHSQASGNQMGEAYAASLLGRLHFLRGDLDSAERWLTTAVESNNTITFVPWPQSFLGEIALERGDFDSASRQLEQAFARATQVGDPCWQGVSRRGLALLAEARGNTTQAFLTLQDAMDRCDRRSDTYVWAKAYILDAQCSLGRVHGHDQTPVWTERLYNLAASTGMRELQTRAMAHRTALGIRDETQATIGLAREIATPRMMALATSL